jgi:hypothetical protein
MTALTILLCVAAAVVVPILVLWIGYVIGIKYERGGWWRLLLLVAGPAAVLDIILNYTVLALLTLDFPRPGEYTFSKRVERLVLDEGWRGEFAFWIAVKLLDPYDPDGFHIKNKGARGLSATYT